MAKCARCGKMVRMLSGIKCPECGHVAGSQSLGEDWHQFDSDLGRKRARDADAQTRPERHHNPKRRYPLRFEE